MREIICIHIGQAGVQLSSSIWELLCAEHNIEANGLFNSDSIEVENMGFKSFFQEFPTGQYVPRIISFDFDPSTLDEIRLGCYRKLFHPNQLISGTEDAANNYARGRYTLGKGQIQYTINKIRKLVNMCENLQGFFVFNSFGGGTGSGFSSLLIERLCVEFSKIPIQQSAVFPSDKLSLATVETYNSLLCSASCLDNSDICNFFDNESTYKICNDNLDIQKPTYNNLNRILSQIFSSSTVSVRFPGCLATDLLQIVTNLVPYPRIHFLLFSYAPLLSERKLIFQQTTIDELTRSVFEPSNQLVNIDMSKGKYICCLLQYRGNITPSKVNDTLFKIKQKGNLRFVDWCPNAFKLSINYQPPMFIPRSEMAKTDRSVTLLANSSVISLKYIQLYKKTQMMLSKKCFIHWYVGEGMEELEFIEALDYIDFLISAYHELSSCDTLSSVDEDYYLTEIDNEEAGKENENNNECETHKEEMKVNKKERYNLQEIPNSFFLKED